MRLALLLALAACSSKPASTTDTKATATGATKTPAFEQLIAADTTSMLRQPGSEMFVLRYVDKLIVGLAKDGTAPPCWTQLIKRVKTGYQLYLPTRSAYFVVEGELPPQEVISCLTSASHGDFTTSQEGELYSVATPVGVAYATWQKPYIVIGTREEVEAALKTPTPESAARWHDLMAPVGSAPTYMLGVDHSFDDIVGPARTPCCTLTRTRP